MSDNINEKKNNEFELTEIYRKILDGRKTIYKSVALFLIIGIILLLGTPKIYKSEATLLIESESKSSGVSNLLQQYGGLVGLNFKESDESLTPELYPDIIKTYPFLIELMSQRVKESKYDSVITIGQYLSHHNRASLIGRVTGVPGQLINLIKGKSEQQKLQSRNSTSDSFPIMISKSQDLLVQVLAQSIHAEKISSKLSNTLKISVEMQDPFVAAQVNILVINSLQGFIVDYRTHKVKTDLKFIESRHAEAQSRYLKAQLTLANYKDQHTNVILASSRTEEERLQSEYTLAFNIYNSLSQQLEQSKIKVQENTPVFTVIDPAIVPLRKIKPRTINSLFSMIILGSLAGIAIIFLKKRFNFYKIFKKNRS